MSPSAHDTVASGLATAMLAGPWRQAAMVARVRSAMGRKTAPKWVTALVEQTLDAYRDPPADRPRELAAFLQTQPAWGLAWQHRRRPQIVEWTPVPTAIAVRPWPIAELPDLSALARLLDLDSGELAWFADVRGLERSVGEPLRHYRWRTLPKRDGVRFVAAPKPRLKEIQRRLLRHVLEPIPVHAAAHGCVRGRSVASAVGPHAGSVVVIRADLEAYFPSISAGRVWGVLRSAGLPEAVAHTSPGWRRPSSRPRCGGPSHRHPTGARTPACTTG
jgi:RNA-directed DNA polymerase